MYLRAILMVSLTVLMGAGLAPAQAATGDGLIGYYKLDESSGTVAADASGQGMDGTLIGEELVWVPGRDGGSLGYPGVDTAARLEVPITSMSVTAGSISIWGALAATQPTWIRYYFGHTTQPQFNNRIQMYLDGGNSLDISLGARGTAIDIVPLSLREWHHIVLTWDNGAYAVYVDGKEVKSGSYSGLTALHPTANIGNDGSSAPYESFGGTLDETRLYNRAITAAEVKEIFEMPAVPRIRAWGPGPADGTRDLTAPLFRWKSLDQIKLHNFYLGTDPNLTAANLVGPRVAMNIYYHLLPLEAGVLYYWRVDGIDPDMVTTYPGDVWTFMMQPPTAYDPTPADGANTVFPSPDLVWRKGLGALTNHVYFGDDPNAVAQGAADTDKGIFADPNYAPGELDSAATYYWRVDEIAPGDIVKTGAVWSFTTVVPIDDFESYTDNDDGTRIFDSWLDGYADQSSGSTVGHLDAPFAEQAIVHGGKQSMPLDYNNVESPFYSEATLGFTAAENWTADGADTLVLYIQGKSGNKVAPVYVTLTDSANHSATVVHPDAKLTLSAKWVEWKIPLSDFTGVNASRIKEIILGAGDRTSPAAGGAGTLYIDDIGLCKPAPAK